MSRSSRSIQRDLAQKLEPMGWKPAGITKGGHLRWTHPRVAIPLVTPSSSSCLRGLANNVALAKRLLRQAGIDPNRTMKEG